MDPLYPSAVERKGEQAGLGGSGGVFRGLLGHRFAGGQETVKRLDIVRFFCGLSYPLYPTIKEAVLDLSRVH